METKTTPHSIIAKHYGNSSAMRKTSIEEFNRDGEHMGNVKTLWMKAEAKWRNNPTEFSRAVADRIKKWAFKEKERLNKKHYPTIKN